MADSELSIRVNTVVLYFGKLSSTSGLGPTVIFRVFSDVDIREIKICTRTLKEGDKCEWLKSEVLKKDYKKANEGDQSVVSRVSCVTVQDNYECLEKIKDGKADVINLDAGAAYHASINFVSTLLTAEKYAGGRELLSIYNILSWFYP